MAYSTVGMTLDELTDSGHHASNEIPELMDAIISFLPGVLGRAPRSFVRDTQQTSPTLAPGPAKKCLFQANGFSTFAAFGSHESRPHRPSQEPFETSSRPIYFGTVQVGKCF